MKRGGKEEGWEVDGGSFEEKCCGACTVSGVAPQTQVTLLAHKVSPAVSHDYSAFHTLLDGRTKYRILLDLCADLLASSISSMIRTTM